MSQIINEEEFRNLLSEADSYLKTTVQEKMQPEVKPFEEIDQEAPIGVDNRPD